MRLAAFCLLFSLPLTKSLSQEAGGSAAAVINPGISWSIGNKPLEFGQHLRAVTEITGAPLSKDLVLGCGKDGLLIYVCTGKDDCHVPVCSKRAKDVKIQQFDFATGTRKDIESVDAATGYFKRQSKMLAVLAVRGDADMNAAVLLDNGAGVHLGPAMKRVLEGQYCFRLTTLPAGSSATTRNFTLNWDRGVESEGIVSLPGLKPGIYSVEKGTPGNEASCSFDADALPAWVLVVPDAQFAKVDADWRSYSAKLNEIEDSGASPSVMATLRRAALSYLADSLVGR